jgi:flagellar hook-basal body complex protein FliE
MGGSIPMESADVFSMMPRPKLLDQGPLASESDDSTSSPSEKLMTSFGQEFEKRIGQVQSMQDNAQKKMRQFAAGKLESVHDVSVAVQKANMGFRLAGLVREKVLSGFEELQQMQ